MNVRISRTVSGVLETRVIDSSLIASYTANGWSYPAVDNLSSFSDQIVSVKTYSDLRSIPTRYRSSAMVSDSAYKGVYLYDPYSTTQESIPDIISPNDGVGRWYRWSEHQDSLGQPNDGSDDYLRLQSLLNDIPTGRQLHVKLRDGVYNLNQQLFAPDPSLVDDIIIEGTGNTVIYGDLAANSNPSLLNIRANEPTLSLSVTSSIARGSYTIQVSGDTSSLSYGDILYLSSSSEYLTGVSNESGYGFLAKNEQITVKSATSNTVTLLRPTVDSYDINLGVVTAAKMNMYRSVKVYGIKFVGGGLRGTPGMSGYTAVSGGYGYVDNGIGQRGLSIKYAKSVDVDCEFELFQGHGCIVQQSQDVLVRAPRIYGLYDMVPTSNFYGVTFSGVNGGSVKDSCGRNLRRVADTSVLYMSRDISHENIQAYGFNGSVCGTHHCEGYSASNVRGRNGIVGADGIRVRAINSVLTNIQIQDVDGHGVLVGPDIDNIESGTTSGRVVISNFNFSGVKEGVHTNLPITGGAITNGVVSKVDNGGSAVALDSHNIDGMQISNIVGVGNGTMYKVVYIQSNKPNNRAYNVSITNIVGQDVMDHIVQINGGADRNNPSDLIMVSQVSGRSVGSSKSAVYWNQIGFFGDNCMTSTGLADVGGNVVAYPNTANRYRLRSMPIEESMFKQPVSDSRPGASMRGDPNFAVASGTTVLGQTLSLNTDPASGEYLQGVYSLGTQGTISGITGSITAGTNVLTVTGNDGLKISNGSFVSIAGAGTGGASLTARVISQTSDSAALTLSTNAVLTVSNASVTRFTPTVTGASLIS